MGQQLINWVSWVITACLLSRCCRMTFAKVGTCTGWGLLTTRSFLHSLPKNKSHFLYFWCLWCLRDGQRVKSPSCTCLLPFWPLHDRWAVCSHARTGLDFSVSLETTSEAWEMLRFTVGRGQPWALPNHDDQNWSWATTLVPFIRNSGWVVKGLVYSPCWCHSLKQLNRGAILYLHSNQLQWALTCTPLSRDYRVDRTFPVGRWSLPVLPCLLPWG